MTLTVPNGELTTPTVTWGLTTWLLLAIAGLTLAGAIAGGVVAGLEAAEVDSSSTVVQIFGSISAVCVAVAGAVASWLGKLRVGESKQLVELGAKQSDWHHLTVTNQGSSGGTVTVDGERVSPTPPPQSAADESEPHQPFLADERTSRLQEIGQGARGRLAQRERVPLDPDDSDDPTPEAAADGDAWGDSSG